MAPRESSGLGVWRSSECELCRILVGIYPTDNNLVVTTVSLYIDCLRSSGALGRLWPFSQFDCLAGRLAHVPAAAVPFFSDRLGVCVETLNEPYLTDVWRLS